MSDMDEKTLMVAPEAAMAVDEPQELVEISLSQPQPQPGDSMPNGSLPSMPSKPEAEEVNCIGEAAAGTTTNGNDDDLSTLSTVSSRAAEETPEALNETTKDDTPIHVATPEPAKPAETVVIEPGTTAASDQEDTIMVDAEPDAGATADNEAEEEEGEQEPEPEPEPEPEQEAQERETSEEPPRPAAAPVSHYPKRKRASTYREPDDFDDTEDFTTPPAVAAPAAEEPVVSLQQHQQQPANPHPSLPIPVAEKHPLPSSAPYAPSTLPLQTASTTMPTKRFANGIKGVIVGHWRDSSAPTREQKHAVIAFIDVRDRLRTRIQPTNMRGEPIDLTLYPIPPGPGGSWTTFGGIVFENQLVGLEQFHIKEFVKLRSDADPNETAEQKFANDKRAVKEAIRKVQANPPPDTPANLAPAIAYGDQIPEHVRELDDQKRKKRRLGSGAAALVQQQQQQHGVVPQIGSPAAGGVFDPRNPLPAPFAAVRQQEQQQPQQQGQGERAIQPAPMVHSPVDLSFGSGIGSGSGAGQVVQQQAQQPQQTPHQQQMQQQRETAPLPTTTLNNLTGARPTKILVGTWSHSSEPNREDRHAVYGILGINDMFRVKVVRETQAGRFLDGNFPQGAGALWITYDQVELDPHLSGLTRAEVKEYVRYRQHQIDQGETEREREENMHIAVDQARLRWAAFERKAGVIKDDDAAGLDGGEHGPSTPDSRNGLRRETRQSVSSTTGQPWMTGAAAQQQSIAPAPSSSMDPGSGTPKGEMPPGSTTPPVKLDGRTKAGRLAKAQAMAAATAQRNAEHAHAAVSMGGRHIEPRPATRSRRSSADAIERAHSLVQRELTRAEANAIRDERHEANREMRASIGAGGGGGPGSGASSAAGGGPPPPMAAPGGGSVAAGPGGLGNLGMDPNIERLDKVWQAQEAKRINKYQAEDAIFHAGIKYQRKGTGPFKNKLASHGAIINIDGEDYVEYRVLLKPTFF